MHILIIPDGEAGKHYLAKVQEATGEAIADGNELYYPMIHKLQAAVKDAVVTGAIQLGGEPLLLSLPPS